MDDFFISKRLERNLGGPDGSREDGADDWFFIALAIEGRVGTVSRHRSVIDAEQLGERVSTLDAVDSRAFVPRHEARTRGEANRILADVDADQTRFPRHRHLVRSRHGRSQVFGQVQLQVLGRGRRSQIEKL